MLYCGSAFHRSLCYEFLSPCFLVASGLFYMFILWINKINWKTWEMWHPICISWIIRGFFLHNYEIKSATPWQENFTTHTLIWERERERGRGERDVHLFINIIILIILNRKGILNQDFVCIEEVNANLTKYTSLPPSRSSPVNFLTTDLLSITISGDCVQTYSSSRRPRSTRVRRSFTPTRGWRPSGRGWSTASFTQRHLRWIGSASPMYVYKLSGYMYHTVDTAIFVNWTPFFNL